MLRVGRVRHELCPIEINENQEAVCLVWVDSLIGNNDHACTIKNMLLELHPDVQLHSEVHLCINLIKTLINKHIPLVTSGDLADEILNSIHSLRFLAAVFIFCPNRELNNCLMHVYEKIVGIFVDQESLLKSIEETNSCVHSI